MVTSSLLYRGRVQHRRFLPKKHEFTYSVLMFLLFLDELDGFRTTIPALRFEGLVTERNDPVRIVNGLPGRYVLRRSDFLPSRPGDLESAARSLYRELTGEVSTGRVAMLANLRSLGWNFNPITLYFFYDGDIVVRAIAEVTNTPWGERHCYLLGAPGPTSFDKAHHVSPFLTMDGTYELTYQAPGEHFRLSMSLFDRDESGGRGGRRLSATMSFEANPCDARTLRRLAWRYPDMALRVSLRIYLQAVRLFVKGIKFVPHPRRHKRRASAHSSD
jgi:uncharacterized protein